VPWKKGESGNPGGVSAARVRFRKLVEQAVSREDFLAVIRTLVDLAKKGKPWAIQLVVGFTIGKRWSVGDKQDEEDRKDEIRRRTGLDCDL